MSKQFLIKGLLLILGFVILSVPLWLKSDLLPVRLWDESRNAVNAAEMFETGDLIVRTFNYEPETYNLKPPLLTWLQVACIKLVGFNELAIRLPSILASLGTLVVIFLIVFTATNNYSFSFLASGITVSSEGFYGTHVGRFGDHDALLIFFCCFLVYFILKYIQIQKSRYIYGAAFAVSLGILAKSISILVLMPGLLLFLLLNKNLIPLLKNKHFYFSIILALIPVIAYYMAREFYQPGFLDLVWNDELFPRYLNKSKNFQFNEDGFGYYFKLLYNSQFKYWSLLIPVSFLAFAFKKTHFKKELILTLIVFLSFLLIVSKGTKNFWYDAPAIPLMAAFIGISLASIYKQLTSHKFIQVIVVIVFLAFPYKLSYSSALRTSELPDNWEAHGISYFLKNDLKSTLVSSNTKIVLDNVYGFEPHLFYVRKLDFEKNIKLERKWLNQITPGDTLLISFVSTFDSLVNRYNVKVIDSLNQYSKLVVVTKK